jgi:hypothetical protein
VTGAPVPRAVTAAAGLLGALGALLTVGGAVLSDSATAAFTVLVVAGAWTGVGALLSLRRPRNPLSWLILAIGVMWAVILLPLDAGPALWPLGGIWIVPLGLMGTQVLLRFPEGRLPSPRWRLFSRATLVLLVAILAGFAFGQPEVDTGTPNPVYQPWVGNLAFALLFVFVGCVLASLASLVVRYRHAGTVEREQVRWIIWAAAVFLGLYVLALTDALGGLGDDLALLGYGLLPLAMGAAITRYHLFDIDRIISRTAAYTLVTGAVVAVYALVVTLVPRLLPVSSAFAVAVATLAAAAASRPALVRVRGAVDRRFDRTRYDASRTVEAFGTRLRDEVDPALVVRDLTDAARTAMQPDLVEVWVRSPS